jgi:hypothetical protein
MVVLMPPPVHRGLGGLDRGEWPGLVQEVGLQGLVPALHLPMVVGEYGLASSWRMPFLRQIRSNSTSEGRGRVKRPVNCLPLSGKTSSGIPNRARAAANAVQTARLVTARYRCSMALSSTSTGPALHAIANDHAKAKPADGA